MAKLVNATDLKSVAPKRGLWVRSPLAAPSLQKLLPMKSHLKLVSTVNMSPEDWLRYRKRGIGASEIAAVMGLSQYKSSIELFYDKIGEELGYSTESIAAFLGHEQESLLAKMWEYWDGSKEGMIANYRSGNKVRRCQRVNAYVNNPNIPWLFVSLDRKINKHDDKEEGTLELKTIGGYEADKWTEGIPPSHVVQVQTQMAVCEFEYGELATLRDNRDFYVLPFEHHPSIIENIIHTTKEFWDRVEEGRSIVTQRYEAQRTFRQKDVEELSAQLMQLEPPADGSDAYTSFMKKKYNIAEPGERLGTPEQLVIAQQHKIICNQIKTLEESRELFANQLRGVFRDQFDKLDFGDDGFVSWKGNKNGVRTFLNKVKVNP